MSNPDFKNIPETIAKYSQPVIILTNKNDWTKLSQDINKTLSLKESQIINFHPEEGVEILRNCLQESSFRPLSGDKKVFYIFGVDLLNKEAGNAILKTLEEPQEFLRIVLFAQSSSKILQTIASRCRKIHYRVDREAEKIQNKLAECFVSGSFNDLQSWIKTAEKEEVLINLLDMIEKLRDSDKRQIALYNKISKVYLQISNSNVNHKLVIENLFIWWKASKKR